MQTTRHTIQMMLRYSAWANERMFTAVAAQVQAHEKLLAPMAHLHRVDLIWQANLEGRSHGFSSRAPQAPPPLGVLRAAMRECDAWFLDYASTLPDERLDENVHFNFVGGGPGRLTRAQILLHVANHKTYHRGFVAQMLLELGSTPPIMDLPVFLRDGPSTA